MFFRDWAQQIIAEELKKQLNTDLIIKAIQKASIKGKIAFYPCSRYTRQILKEIKDQDPTLLESICGCFDKSTQATSATGIKVYHISQLNDFTGEISMLVIASSTYYARQEQDILEHTNYSGPILKTSFFDCSMPEGSPEELLSEIEQITDMLHDKKSQMTYLLSWISRLLNDEDVTSLFESENEIPKQSNDFVTYKDYHIYGINDNELKKELFSGVYNMKQIRPVKGDVVLDVGAFRGETAIVFSDLVGETGKVYAFEPIKASYEIIKKNIFSNKLEKIIEPVNMGCSSRIQTTSAVSSESGAPWTFISHDDGSIPVELTTIDEFVYSNKINKVDFIKMDVEGFENDVILGAKKVLQTHQPKLAIALYHKSSDLIAIPRLINELADYKLFVRCNMDGPYGLTIFCI